MDLGEGRRAEREGRQREEGEFFFFFQTRIVKKKTLEKNIKKLILTVLGRHLQQPPHVDRAHVLDVHRPAQPVHAVVPLRVERHKGVSLVEVERGKLRVDAKLLAPPHVLVPHVPCPPQVVLPGPQEPPQLVVVGVRR